MGLRLKKSLYDLHNMERALRAAEDAAGAAKDEATIASEERDDAQARDKSVAMLLLCYVPVPRLLAAAGAQDRAAACPAASRTNRVPVSC